MTLTVTCAYVTEATMTPIQKPITPFFTAKSAFFLFVLLYPALLDAQSVTGEAGESRGTTSPSADIGAASLRDNTPLISADSTLMFFNSARKGYRPWATWDSVKNRYDEDIYYARRAGSGSDVLAWESPRNLGPQINTSHDDAIAAISRNGTTAYFTSLKRGWERDGGPYYQARLSGTKWTDVRGMGGGITRFFMNRDRSLNFRVYGATISPDGKDFYFATNVGSPNGVHQIWVSHQIDGEWGYPEKLGPEINKGEGSYAPQIGEDGKTLFFASHKNDEKAEVILASVVTDDGDWQQSVVLGVVSDTASMNVAALADPLHMATTPASVAAAEMPAAMPVQTPVIVASAATAPPVGTQTRMLESLSESMLRSAAPEVQRLSRVVLVKVMVTDKATGLPVRADITIEDLSAAKMVYDAKSTGKGSYTAVLQPGKDYGISVKAPGYLFISERYTIPADASFKEMSRSFVMEKLTAGGTFVVNNIFFGYNSDSLDNASRLELDRLIGLMKETAGLRIEIGGHTDNIGSMVFNRQLSLARAESVKRYMIAHGAIEPDRIGTQGYGFARPAAPNDSEEGRKQNRRTEVKVLELGGTASRDSASRESRVD
jgi:outer membrane protein OmpA-like peptidoglycan-associated protein